MTPNDRIAALEAALEWYAVQFCEGFCNDLPQAGTYCVSMDNDCGGCKARAALAASRTPDPDTNANSQQPRKANK